jgi:hypothetical protein
MKKSGLVQRNECWAITDEGKSIHQEISSYIQVALLACVETGQQTHSTSKAKERWPRENQVARAVSVARQKNSAV